MLFSSATRPVSLAAACLFAAALHGYSQPIPPSTAIPVVLTRSVTAGQAKPGDLVSAKTIQPVLLPDGRTLPSGTPLTGHVVASIPFVPDTSPYAEQKPSVLSVRFDHIAAAGSSIAVALSVRAIAGPVASHEAETPHQLDEIDWSNTRILVGGESTSPLDRILLAPDGQVVGYNRKQGVFAHLLAAGSVNAAPDVQCDATNTEQSLGIFSANACGVYGLNSVSLAGNGSHNDGAFVLESRQRPVTLYAGATALLEVIAN